MALYVGGTAVTGTQTLDATTLSGNLPAISGASLTGVSSTTPAFSAFNTDGDYTFSDNSWHLAQVNSEIYDSGGCYNNTGSSTTLNGLTAPEYSFVPNSSGYYFCSWWCVGDAQSNNQLEEFWVSIYLNGNAYMEMAINHGGASDMMAGASIGGLISLNGTGDYIQPYVKVDDTSAHGVSIGYNASRPKNQFTAFKVA